MIVELIAGGKVLTASSAAHPAPLPKSAATPSELADDLAATSTKATHSMPSSGQADFNSGSETQKRALPKQDSPAVHSPPAKQAQQAASAQTDKRHKAPLRQDGLPSTLNRASLADAATAVDNSSLPTTAEAFLATLQTSRIAADVPLPSRHAHKQQSLPAASSAGNTAGPSETAATSAAPQTDAGVPVSSPDVQTPVRPLPLVTALSADQLRAILSSAGMQPAGTPMPVTASMPPIPPPGGSKTRPPASPIPAAHLGATLSPRAEVSTAYTPSAPVAAPTGAAATPSATPLSSSIGDKLVAAAVTPAVPSGAHAPAAHSTPVHAGTNASASATDALKEGMTLSASVSAPAAPPPVVLPVPPQVAVPAVQAASAAAAVVAPALTPSAAQGVPPPPVLEVPQPTPSAALGVPPPPPLGSPPPKPTAAQGIPPLPPSAVPASSSVRDIPGPPLEDPPAPPLLPLLIASDPSLFSPQLKPASGTAAEPTQEKRKKKKRKRDEHQPVTAVTGTSMSAHQSKQAQQASQAAGTAVASQGPPVDAASFYARYQELAVKPAAAFQPLPPGPYAPRASPPPPHLPLPTPQLTAAQVASPPTKAPYLLSSFNKPLPLPTQGDAKRPRTHSASTKITVMRQVHSSSPVPAVGDQAVVAWLKNVKSLVHDPKQKFSLKNAIQAIGEFAIGSNAEEEIFLGNMHHQADVHHQVCAEYACCS